MNTDETPSGEFNLRFDRAMDERERVRWSTAEQQVDAFISVLATRYGIKEDDLPEMLDGVKWALKHRKMLESIQDKAWLTLMGLGLTGLAVATWEGVKALVGRGPH